MKRLLKLSFLSFFLLSLAGGLERLHWQSRWDATGVTRKWLIDDLEGRCEFLDDDGWVEWKVLGGKTSYRCPRFGGDMAIWPWFEEIRVRGVYKGLSAWKYGRSRGRDRK